MHESLKSSRLEQQVCALRSHTEQVPVKAHRAKDLRNTAEMFFSRQKQYYEKIGKSVTKKTKDDKERLEALKEVNGKRQGGIAINL